MRAPLFPALATEIAVRLTGVGSFLPDRRVSNQQILDRVRPARPGGRLLEPEWIERHVGIFERRLDFDFEQRRKASREEGGLYDGDLALRAARGPSTTVGSIRASSTCSCTCRRHRTRSPAKTTCGS